jgi:two-component system chemotaxis response regulator CheV
MEKDKLMNEAVKEVEILEFRAGGNSYGIYVSDIREILPYNKKPLPIPNAHPFIEGIIKPRDFLIPIVNLTKSMRLNETDEIKNDMLIVTGILDLNIAFHVDSVRGIHRIMSSEIMQPGKKLTTSLRAAIAGIIPHGDYTIEVLDFRTIIHEVNPQINVE